MAKTEKMDRVDLRITKEEKELLGRAAVLSGMSLSAFLVTSALDEARKITSRSEKTVLSGKDRELFYSLLKNPPKPNKNLVNLMRGRSR